MRGSSRNIPKMNFGDVFHNRCRRCKKGNIRLIRTKGSTHYGCTKCPYVSVGTAKFVDKVPFTTIR